MAKDSVSAKKALAFPPQAWKGAMWGVIAVTFGVMATHLGITRASGAAWSDVVALLAVLPLSAVVGAATVWLIRLLCRTSNRFLFALVLSGPVLYVAFYNDNTLPAAQMLSLITLVLATLMGGSVGALTSRGWRESSWLRRGVTLLAFIVGSGGLGWGIYLHIDDGSPAVPYPAVPGVAGEVLADNLDDPSAPGPFAVQTLTYGSGTDRHRPEYGESVSLRTEPVDGTPFLSGWQRLRTAYWGFGADELPLNARVWYPSGDGPFPLALIVHGGHLMNDYSDPGYDYLGVLLASRGIVLVSVDHNYLNSGLAADLLGFRRMQGTDVTRGWLLLEHLQQWRTWSRSPGNPFHGLVDMDHVAVMGHSLGGQAAATAAALNGLSHYPDDATLTFDYNFHIRSVVAIAPADRQYMPAGHQTPLVDVSYLTLQGSLDMDAASFMGAWQYQRVEFTEGHPGFKASVYIHGANHGQFNSTWGRADNFGLGIRRYNLEQIMPEEAQQRVAKVYISAFLAATLQDRQEFLPMFRDHRQAAGWLPDTLYLTRFQDASTKLVCTWEEDIDVTTTTLPGGSISAENLHLWREDEVWMRFGPLGSYAVYLGWDSESQEGTPSYRVTLPDSGLDVSAEDSLIFSLADAREEQHRAEPIDLSIEVTDRSGTVAALPLGRIRALPPRVRTQLTKTAAMWHQADSEPVLQTYDIPLAVFLEANAALRLEELASVSLVFDRTPKGTIILDDLGFRGGD